MRAYLVQRAAQFPTVDLGASAVAAQNSATIAPPLASNAQIYSLYTAQLNIAYVLDVFGGLRRQTEAAAAQAENQKFLTQAVYLTLTANVANAAVQPGQPGYSPDGRDRGAHRGGPPGARCDAPPAASWQRASTADIAAAEATLVQVEQLVPPLQKQIDQER